MDHFKTNAMIRISNSSSKNDGITMQGGSGMSKSMSSRPSPMKMTVVDKTMPKSPQVQSSKEDAVHLKPRSLTQQEPAEDVIVANTAFELKRMMDDLICDDDSDSSASLADEELLGCRGRGTDDGKEASVLEPPRREISIPFARMKSSAVLKKAPSSMTMACRSQQKALRQANTAACVRLNMKHSVAGRVMKKAAKTISASPVIQRGRVLTAGTGTTLRPRRRRGVAVGGLNHNQSATRLGHPAAASTEDTRATRLARQLSEDMTSVDHQGLDFDDDDLIYALQLTKLQNRQHDSTHTSRRHIYNSQAAASSRKLASTKSLHSKS
jgi:hypothetical protein